MYNGQISESDAREFDFDMSKTNFWRKGDL